ncbi:MAG: cytochrome ubiquinol oxidase subunit I [Nitrospinota bacterium]
MPNAYAAEAEAPSDEAAVSEGEGEAEAEDLLTWKPMPAPKLETRDYPVVGGWNSRLGVWFVAQLHLFFAAFVLGVPIYVWVIELIGIFSKDPRYDRMAHETLKVAMTGFSLAASFGGLLSIMLVVFYPDFMKYLVSVFGNVMVFYALVFFAESFFLYTYYYGWDKMTEGKLKKLHSVLGLCLNGAGMTLMFVSNSWASFMMAPSGVAEDGTFLGSVWDAMAGPLWGPLNLHRFIANIAYGGSLTAAFAAYKYISSTDPKDRAHYDWTGYISFFVTMAGLLPLPFAGYWLTKEVYAYSQQMGITLMGGVFAWLFILQAVLIGALFLSANYYLWCSLGRSPGSDRYKFMITPLGFIIITAFLVWFTPHTIIMTSKELSQIGDAHHPVLGFFGVMAAKNGAVNILIISTFLSYQILRRSNIKLKSEGFWAVHGTSIQIGLYIAAVVNVLSLSVYSYYLPASVRIGLSVPQVSTTFFVLIVSSIMDVFMFRGSGEVGEMRWGKMPVRSQYALFLLAISFTWLMGLMGYVRSAIRQHWHVYTIFRDNSTEAFTPTLPYAASVVTVIV